MANVVMPQMGESIAEGTIVRWIKKSATRSIVSAVVRDFDRQGRCEFLSTAAPDRVMVKKGRPFRSTAWSRSSVRGVEPRRRVAPGTAHAKAHAIRPRQWARSNLGSATGTRENRSTSPSSPSDAPRLRARMPLRKRRAAESRARPPIAKDLRRHQQIHGTGISVRVTSTTSPPHFVSRVVVQRVHRPPRRLLGRSTDRSDPGPVYKPGETCNRAGSVMRRRSPSTG